MIKKENGITLIALIITIIIMLILVAVTITMAINGGLFGYAGRGVSDTQIAGDKEIIAAALGNWGVEKWAGTKTLKDVLVEEFGEENVAEVSNGCEVTMPSGRVYLINEDNITTKSEKSIFIESKIGDYVNYDCVTGVDSTLLSYQSPSSLNGSTDKTISVNTTMDENNKSIIKWRILGIDENEQILLIAADPITNSELSKYYLKLKGQNGYLNGVNELNKICGMYGHGEYADTNKYIYSYSGTNITTGGRSVTVEDVNKILQYVPRTLNTHVYSKNASDGYIYYDGTKGSLNVQNFTYYSETTNTWISLGSGESITIQPTSYTYNVGADSDKQKMMRYYDNSTSNALYWLASNRIKCDSRGFIDFVIFTLDSGQVSRIFSV